MKFSQMVKAETEVTHLIADMAPRYWEDAQVNGVDENDEAPTIPLRDGDAWKLKIDLETGQIAGWPQGTTAETHYKVCDAGIYSLIDANGVVVAKNAGYVPEMLSSDAEGFGDYVILNIDKNGYIHGWKANFDYFIRCAQ